MEPILMTIIWMFVVGVVGAGGGFWLWYVLARKKHIQWQARVYQLGDGIQKPITDKGKIVANFRLSDLRPYTTDIAIQTEVKGGAKNYMLKRLRKALPVVTADCVEVWGPKQKWVHILLEGDTCTLLKSGYDRKIGQQIFTPMPHDRITMIKTEMQSRKDKIEKREDAFKSISTWVVVGIWAISLLGASYINIQGYIKISENLQTASSELSQAQIATAQIYRDVYVDQNYPKGNIKIEEAPEVSEGGE